ncbi:ATP-dependent helicase [Anopheles sinensis]|uniref:ATP-dependent helicase n=1 Tax=Anopheles sinensis TaxID=74873 RepID=A0A084W955_ANOSI|nr:ATP-dependent helicase [Anopheles sinensis]
MIIDITIIIIANLPGAVPVIVAIITDKGGTGTQSAYIPGGFEFCGRSRRGSGKPGKPGKRASIPGRLHPDVKGS